jgi:retinol dehydrogenase-12
VRSPAKGARSLVWLALDPAAAQLDGAYVIDMKVKQPSTAARDDALAEGLWERSEALTGG